MKILVVDDEVDVVILFQQRFRREIKNNEMEFVFSHSGDEALNYLVSHNDESHLVLSDINMPGMSGLELLAKIRVIDAPFPPKVIMISAYGDEENYQEAKRLGATDFFQKPVDFAALKDFIKLCNI